MFATAIVIFREALEIAVILGVVLAATRGLKNRLFWIIAGFGGGVFGAGLVALFARTISDAVSGIGQEIFNAAILFTAVFFIGWTVLWMRKHSMELTSELRKTGHEVAVGKLPFYSLSLIIGIAILREGSEIVLFIYGMVLSGQSAESIITGSVIGFALGTMAGVMLYFGLIKISAKYMFRVTSWLLILLVAGLSAQGAGYLSAAGYFSNLSKPLWDSSWLLSDGSIAGKALHSLIGYSAHPSAVQLVFYLGTLAAITGAILLTEGRKKHAVAAIMIAISLLAAKPAMAIDEIYEPNISKGEWEIEYNGNTTFDRNRSKNDIENHETELEYSPTNYWQTALTGAFAREPGGNFRMDATALENQFQFTNPGEYWLDSGMRVSYGFAEDKGEANSLEVKLLLEKDLEKFRNIVNIGFEQEVGKHSEGGPDWTFIASTRYLYKPWLAPGAELQNDMGNSQVIGHFQQQGDYAGPAIYGQLPWFDINANHLKYELAYLFGLTDSAAQSAMRVKLEYEFRF